RFRLGLILCDNIPGTVTVIKINGTNEILGGYNPLVWTSNNSFEWFTTIDSFIFSLKTQNLSNSILSRIIHANQVIGCNRIYGPVFGGAFYTANDDKIWCYGYKNKYYKKRLRSDCSNLLIDEFEGSIKVCIYRDNFNGT
ncbi:12994_t:CDS:2, partial [Dentiscutata heterogama]